VSSASISQDDLVVVGNASDDPFAIDMAFAMGQAIDIADLISMKTFANSEFCPRFISDENDFTRIGERLEGRTVVIVSTSSRTVSRQNLAMRNLIMARAAKENGAREVVLVDIFNSGVLMTGFITDDQGEVITVFVPTGPNPTSGNIYHMPQDRVFKTSATIDNGMKSIISCGAGSKEVFALRNEN